jgi:hypothetical protein
MPQIIDSKPNTHAESLEIIQGQLVTAEVEKRILEHTSMAVTVEL